MMVTVAALTLMLSLMLYELGTEFVYFLRLPPRLLAVFWLTIAAAMIALAWFGPSDLRSMLAEHESRVPTTCVVLESEARPLDGGGAERWLRVRWEAEGVWTLSEPIMWWMDPDLTLETALDGFEAGTTINCRYDAGRPSLIFADGTAAIKERLAAVIPLYVGAGMFLLVAFVNLFRRHEHYRPPAPGVRMRLFIQFVIIGVGVVSYKLTDVSDVTWIWWAVATIAALVWLAVAVRDILHEDRLTERLMECLEDYEHWPSPPSDSSDIVIDPYDSDRMTGLWNGMRVRVASGPSMITMEVDVPEWPHDVFLGPRGSHSDPPQPMGDPEFDRRVQVHKPTATALRRLRPDARRLSADVMDETGAVLDDSVLTVRIDVVNIRLNFATLSQVVDVAVLLSRSPISPEERLAEETAEPIRAKLRSAFEYPLER